MNNNLLLDFVTNKDNNTIYTISHILNMITNKLVKIAVAVATIMHITSCDSPPKVVDSASSWQLVYQNDFNGLSLYGDPKDLVQEIKKGNPIRVSWGGTEPDGSSWIEFAEPDFTTIMGDTSVVVQFPISVIQTHYTDPAQSFLDTKQPAGWRALMSTNGNYHQFHYDLINQNLLREMYCRTNISWFVFTNQNGSIEMPNLTPKNAFFVDSLIDHRSRNQVR